MSESHVSYESAMIDSDIRRSDVYRNLQFLIEALHFYKLELVSCQYDQQAKRLNVTLSGPIPERRRHYGFERCDPTDYLLPKRESMECLVDNLKGKLKKLNISDQMVLAPKFPVSFSDVLYQPAALSLPKEEVQTSFAKLTITKPHAMPFNNITFPAVNGGLVPGGILSIFDSEDALEKAAREHDDYLWPHKGGCPACGADAYVGFSHVDCSNSGCQNGKG